MKFRTLFKSEFIFNLLGDIEKMILKWHLSYNPANTYLFKVNNRNTRKRYEICLKITIKTSEWRHWRCSGAFIGNFEYISHLFLVFLLLNFEQVNAADLALSSPIWNSMKANHVKRFLISNTSLYSNGQTSST